LTIWVQPKVAFSHYCCPSVVRMLYTAPWAGFTLDPEGGIPYSRSPKKGVSIISPLLTSPKKRQQHGSKEEKPGTAEPPAGDFEFRTSYLLRCLYRPMPLYGFLPGQSDRVAVLRSGRGKVLRVALLDPKGITSELAALKGLYLTLRRSLHH
jgi:hypothetical protein